jgi:hypothetical protein
MRSTHAFAPSELFWHADRVLGVACACSIITLSVACFLEACVAGHAHSILSHHHLTRRLCCLCGLPIQPNPANMCVNCMRNQVDITEGVQKQV